MDRSELLRSIALFQELTAEDLDALAAALVARETLNAEEILEITGIKPARPAGIVAGDGRGRAARDAS